jgi:hypothetical protein
MECQFYELYHFGIHIGVNFKRVTHNVYRPKLYRKGSLVWYMSYSKMLVCNNLESIGELDTKVIILDVI